MNLRPSLFLSPTSSTSISCCSWQLWLGIFLFVQVQHLETVIATTTPTTPTSPSSSKPSSSNANRRPPFVSHVDKETLWNAIEKAKTFHVESIRKAIDNYPIDLSMTVDLKFIESIRLKRYTIIAPGELPDFSNELDRDIFVTTTPLLTSQECQQVINTAEEHFQQTNKGEWTQLPSGQYMVAGFWIKDIPTVHSWFIQVVRQRLFPLLSKTFPNFCSSPDDLCVDNAYLFKYNPTTGGRTDVHTDSGILSFTIALNSKNEYVGGGTWFDGLAEVKDDDIIPMDNPIIEMEQAGQVTIRPGGVKHCGFAVESGERYIIGGFCMHQKKPETIRQIMAAAQQSGNIGSFVKLLEAALVINPKFDSAYNLLAVAYQETKQTISQRIEVLEYCLEHVHPYAGDVAYALGSIYKDDQVDLSKAKKCFEICLKADTHDVEAMIALMMVAAAQKDSVNEQLYAQRIINNPVSDRKALAQAYCNLGVLTQESNQPELEMEYYRQALHYAPDRFAPRYSLAAAYASTGRDYLLACQEFRNALDLASHQMTTDQRQQTLQSLYKATALQIQIENNATSGKSTTTTPSRDEILARFHEIMGYSYFQELVSLQQQQQQQQEQRQE